MKLATIERQSTRLAEIYHSLYAVFPIMFFTSLLSSLGSSVAFVGCALMSAAVIMALTGRRAQVTRLLARHTASLAAVAAARGWQVIPPEAFPQKVDAAFPRMSLSLLATRGQQYVNCVKSDSWVYADWSYDHYEQTKNGEYKAAVIYYGVMAARLPRVMPNVFFDSKAERGRQFKAQFAANQRHSLEGDFDQYFDTYFVEGYTIDSLSFITPDVMLALEAASVYDIEIIDDQVLLYGPVYVDATRLDDMAAKLLAIQAQLAENARTYRDERLPAAEGRQTVALIGMVLRRPQPRVVGATVVALATAVLYVVVYTWLKAHL